MGRRVTRPRLKHQFTGNMGDAPTASIVPALTPRTSNTANVPSGYSRTLTRALT